MDDLKKLYAHRQSLKQKIRKYQTELHQSLTVDEHLKDLDNTREQEVVSNILSQMSLVDKTLTEVTGVNDIRQVVLDSLDRSEVLEDVVRGGQPAGATASQCDRLRQLLDTEAKLNDELMREHEAMVAQTDALWAVQEANRDLMTQNRKLAAQAKQLASSLDQPESATAPEDEQRLADAVTKLRLLRGIYQGLIIGSGIHWAEDAELKQDMLDLGADLEDVINKHRSDTDNT